MDTASRMNGEPTDAPEIDRTTVSHVLGRIDVPGDLDDLIESLRQSVPSAARVRADFIDRFEISDQPVAWYSLGRLGNHQRSWSRTLDYAAGQFYLQDAGSMLALAAIQGESESLQDAVRGRTVCDLCAAPGGKASAILEGIEEGVLVANEPIRSRLGSLRYLLARTGQHRYIVTSMDPDRLVQQSPGRFDIVLVDAPCSGQTMVAAGKHDRSAFDSKHIEHAAARQRRILMAAARLLAPGGRLIYSTCTLSRLENEDRVSDLVDAPEFVGQLSVQDLPSLRDYQSEPIGDGFGYRLWPHRDGCHGGFAASIIRDNVRSPTHTTTRPRRPIGTVKLARSTASQIGDWWNVKDSSLRWFEHKDALHAVAADLPDDLLTLSATWLKVATRKGRTWRPDHESCLLRGSQAGCLRSIELTADEAIAYLAGQAVDLSANSRRSSINLNQQESTSGFLVVTYGGGPLGWCKLSNGKLKNHLPSGLRIAAENISKGG